MVKCQHCGAEVSISDRFCYQCGAYISQSRKEEVTYRHRYRNEREACFGPKGSSAGLWGSISAGVFITGLGLLWILDLWWPGILFLIGLMLIIGGIFAYLRH